MGVYGSVWVGITGAWKKERKRESQVEKQVERYTIKVHERRVGVRGKAGV